MKLSDFKNRVEAEMKSKGFTENSLAKAAGMGSSSVRNILQNKDQNPRIDTILKIANALNVSVNYLLTNDHYRNENLTIVPELSVTVSAGDGSIINEEEIESNWAIPRAYLQPRVQDGLDKLRIIRVQGNSMLPEYNPDDRILVDTSYNTPTDGDFVIADGLGNTMVKRLQVIQNGDSPRIKVISLNKSYEPYELAANEIHVNGKVIAKWDWK